MGQPKNERGQKVPSCSPKAAEQEKFTETLKRKEAWNKGRVRQRTFYKSVCKYFSGNVLTKQLQEKTFSFLSECGCALGHTLLLSLLAVLIAPMQRVCVASFKMYMNS